MKNLSYLLPYLKRLTELMPERFKFENLHNDGWSFYEASHPMRFVDNEAEPYEVWAVIGPILDEFHCYVYVDDERSWLEWAFVAVVHHLEEKEC